MNMLQFQYDMTADDFVAFNLYHFEHSDIIRHRLLVARLTIPVVMTVVMLLVPLLGLERGRTYVAGLLSVWWAFLVPIAIYFYVPWAYRRRTSRLVDRMLKEGSTKALLGLRTVTLAPDSITSAVKGSSSTVSWDAVDRIVENDVYGFIYVSSLSAVLIPRRSFASNDEFMTFMNQARTFQQNS